MTSLTNNRHLVFLSDALNASTYTNPVTPETARDDHHDLNMPQTRSGAGKAAGDKHKLDEGTKSPPAKAQKTDNLKQTTLDATVTRQVTSCHGRLVDMPVLAYCH